MNSPKHLRHKPIISINDYDVIDGLYEDKNSDAKALSIGHAQYDNEEISLKVWRHTGEKWSRQSEELPIHRNLDLTILFVASLSHEILNPQSIRLKPNGKLTVDNPSDISKIKQYFEDNKEFIEPRLKELKQLLNEIM